MTEALISPQVLTWALERAQIPISRLTAVSPRAPLWETGDAVPTFRQAQRLAKILHIPFGYLFLKEPPEEATLLPDLRTVGDRAPGELSPDLRDVINDALQKQAWYKDYAIESGLIPPPFIGRFSTDSDVFAVAEDITQTLGIDHEFRLSVRSWKDFLAVLTKKAEEVGVLMMHNGIVGSNTHRSLNINEFRGFAISDPIVPLIFINWKDAQAAKIFTLVHELTHLWINESGISNSPLSVEEPEIHIDSERFCNAVAAEVLVPEASFREHWNTRLGLHDNAANLVRYYRVSSVVIGRRAFELGMITWDQYLRYYKEQSQLWRVPTGSGGSYYATARSRLGDRFAVAVVISTQQGRTLYRDAGNLLGITPAKIPRFSQELGL